MLHSPMESLVKGLAITVVVLAAGANALASDPPMNFIAGARDWDLSMFVLLVVSGMAVCGFVHARHSAPASIA